MKREFADIFHKTFDDVLTADGFVQRSLSYWHIDFSNYWYFVIWLSPEGIGNFDIYFDFGGLMEINSDDVNSKSEYASFYSFHKLFYRPSKFFKLWWIPEDFPSALRVFKENISPMINSFHSLFDLFVFRNKFWTDQCMTLSEGEKWIDALLLLRRFQEAQDTFDKVKLWIDFLQDKLTCDEKTAREKLQYYNALSPRIRTEIQHFIDSWQESLDDVPRQRIQLESLRKEVDMVEKTIYPPCREERINEIKLRLENSCKSLRDCFSEEEIHIMTGSSAKIHV